MGDSKLPPIAVPGALEQRSTGLHAASERLAGMIAELQRDRRRVQEEDEPHRERVAELAEAHRQLCDELVWVEERVAHLAGLHAALRLLHEAGSRAEVIATVQEVVVNLVGSEQLALVLTEPGGALRTAAALGVPGRAAGLDLEAIGSAMVQDGIRTGASAAAVLPGLLAFVPLRARGAAVGALLLFGLLPHKPSLEPRDLEVLELLQVHAALALGGCGGSTDGGP